jgi:hypothetical protein
MNGAAIVGVPVNGVLGYDKLPRCLHTAAACQPHCYAHCSCKRLSCHGRTLTYAWMHNSEQVLLGVTVNVRVDVSSWVASMPSETDQTSQGCQLLDVSACMLSRYDLKYRVIVWSLLYDLQILQYLLGSPSFVDLPGPCLSIPPITVNRPWLSMYLTRMFHGRVPLTVRLASTTRNRMTNSH